MGQRSEGVGPRDEGVSTSKKAGADFVGWGGGGVACLGRNGQVGETTGSSWSHTSRGKGLGPKGGGVEVFRRSELEGAPKNLVEIHLPK